MTAWTAGQLAAIAGASKLRIASQRRDGTPRVPVPVWVVRNGDGLFVRTWQAIGSAWDRSAQASGRGHIRAGGVEADVTFIEETHPAVNDQIDRLPRQVRPLRRAHDRLCSASHHPQASPLLEAWSRRAGAEQAPAPCPITE
jgi:hypothetical protein